MATYVVSDIHGEYDTLMALLNKISFSEEDTLYILGDVVDRGREGVKILDIDCSVGYGLSAARLACLRLDDMAEFYQEVIKN